MFEAQSDPRVFALSSGIDFARELAAGLRHRLAGKSPEVILNTVVYVNTSRMRRRLINAFSELDAGFSPRVRLVTDLAIDPESIDLPMPTSALRRKLEVSQLVKRLLETEERRAPMSALYDLSDSLVRLMDEMHDEGVSPDDLFKLDVTDQSGHWQQSLAFFRILEPYFKETGVAASLNARLRTVVERKIATWATTPPDHPVIVAGSTGSRGATALFMEGVAQLPQGAVILPGFDWDMPNGVWGRIDTEDHPQFRFKAFLDRLDVAPDQVMKWTETPPVSSQRNAVLSLALRPAPVTSDWITDGPNLGDIKAAMKDVTLVEADSPKAEAEAIAMRLRQAVDDGITAALVTPDRMLTRQVAAALDRWDVIPDDSAGVPLLNSPPGRLLGLLVNAAGQDVSAHTLLTLLKHPLAHSGNDARGEHLRLTREYELHLRQKGPPFPDRDSLEAWGKQNDCPSWAAWVSDLIESLQSAKAGPLHELLSQHLDRAEALAEGPNGDGSGELWNEAAGREAKRLCERLRTDADAGGVVTPKDFATIFRGVLAEGVVRDRDAGHPQILIWGTLEARVQTADLVILGGMNDGTWPESPSPDPWLNRDMRKAAGLLLPERRIGLSAHDFQQAVAAKSVWITRSKRTAEAETVPSRWINRLTNLLAGLPDQGGEQALKTMRDKGDVWLRKVQTLSVPEQLVESAKRPSPCPPIEARPKQLSVTGIRALIRDPYAVYAERVLRLRSLNPLAMQADAPLKGMLFHKVLEDFFHSEPDLHDPDVDNHLTDIARRVIAEGCPWPTFQQLWITQFETFAPKFIKAERQRHTVATFFKSEQRGEVKIDDLDFTLVGIADRLDQTPNGDIIIYDYKTGMIPTVTMQENFDKQLLLESAMVVQGGFKDIGPAQVHSAAFLSLKPDMKVVPAPLDKLPPDTVWADFRKLITQWRAVDRGYTARMALVQKTDSGPYDHLSRHGEWTTSDSPQKVYLP